MCFYIFFSFTAFKEPIRKEIQKLAASDYTNQNLVGGFQSAQDILDYHCESQHGKMLRLWVNARFGKAAMQRQ